MGSRKWPKSGSGAPEAPFFISLITVPLLSFLNFIIISHFRSMESQSRRPASRPAGPVIFIFLSTPAMIPSKSSPFTHRFGGNLRRICGIGRSRGRGHLFLAFLIFPFNDFGFFDFFDFLIFHFSRLSEFSHFRPARSPPRPFIFNYFNFSFLRFNCFNF